MIEEDWYFQLWIEKQSWKEHMDVIMNEEHDCDQVTNSDMVEGYAEITSYSEVINVIKIMKTERQLDLLK